MPADGRWDVTWRFGVKSLSRSLTAVEDGGSKLLKKQPQIFTNQNNVISH